MGFIEDLNNNKNVNIALKLIMINVVFFMIQLFSKSFESLLILDSQLVLLKPWTLLTTAFLHADMNHIFFNMYALILFGPLVERKIGSKRFLIFYLIAAIIASLSFVIFSPLGKAVGASGAIMGILGLVIILFPNMRVLFFFVIPMSMRTAGIIFALIDVVGLFNPGNGIANVAHLTGLACGLIYGKYLLNKSNGFKQRFTDPNYVKEVKNKYYTKGGSKVKVNKDPSKVVIELSDDDVNEYLKYGKI